MNIYRGEAFPLTIGINDSGTEISADKIDAIELMIGKDRFVWPDSLKYEDGVISVWLSQEYTFSKRAGEKVTPQVRVKFKGEEVHRVLDLGTITFLSSDSEEVL